MSDEPVARFTTREQEVLCLVATGMSAKEVSRALHMSPRTVECHLDRMRQRTGTKNRVQLVAHAAHNGMIVLN